MSYVISIGGWVNFSGEGGGSSKFLVGGGGAVKRRQSPDFRSPEVGISAKNLLIVIAFVNY